MGLFKNLFGSSGKRVPKVDIARRFRLHNRIGQGSMSKVYRATDTKTGRTVCLKILDLTKTEQLKRRFVGLKRPDEGEVAISLVHPNIVRTFEYGYTTHKEEFLSMEYIEGVTLNFMIDTRSKQLEGRELDFLIQAGEAVQYFHEQGYIHRDLCPRNLMVTSDQVIKLIDFGLAVPNTPAFRRPGNRTGTANYMAPELIRRAPTDERIDVFSFGVSMYETLTGGLPWESAESMQAMLQHLNSPPRDPRELKEDLDEELVRVLTKALERDPKDRYHSMREVVAELRRLAGREE